ncbi:uncharacterized protein A4U43_C07F32790 [Asparagus officinalis]|uniref:Uncharacterized protein n=1 Tax=Asparagus officinalis TaxID=4686 RepID=A0A5P1EGY4_ASPOF|nr:uncharacterized protein A4U43_C07F32790 [Asparagus officinalis]
MELGRGRALIRLRQTYTDPDPSTVTEMAQAKNSSFDSLEVTHIDSQLETQSSSKKNLFWTREMDSCLSEALVEQIHRGQKCDKSFKNDVVKERRVRRENERGELEAIKERCVRLENERGESEAVKERCVQLENERAYLNALTDRPNLMAAEPSTATATPDLLRSICFIPSATWTAGFDLKFRLDSGKDSDIPKMRNYGIFISKPSNASEIDAASTVAVRSESDGSIDHLVMSVETPNEIDEEVRVLRRRGNGSGTHTLIRGSPKLKTIILVKITASSRQISRRLFISWPVHEKVKFIMDSLFHDEQLLHFHTNYHTFET